MGRETDKQVRPQQNSPTAQPALFPKNRLSDDVIASRRASKRASEQDPSTPPSGLTDPSLDPVPWSGVYLEDMDTPATSATVLTIGQLASAAHVNVETIRYYERRSLLPEPPRTRAGYRQYDRDAIRRVRFIKRAQDLGFTLKEIDELLALQVRHGAACDEVEERVRLKIARVKEMMGELARVHKVLTALGGACRERRPTEECPILEVLDHDELTDE